MRSVYSIYLGSGVPESIAIINNVLKVTIFIKIAADSKLSRKRIAVISAKYLKEVGKPALFFKITLFI